MPGLQLSGLDEHATRMPGVALMDNGRGGYLFEDISIRAAAPVKLAAIEILSRSLDAVAGERDQRARNNLLWEHCLAARMRFHHFAVEDEQRVAAGMQNFLVRLFKIPTLDQAAKDQKTAIVRSLESKSVHDYERDHPGAGELPKRRARVLLARLHHADPSLFP